MSRSCNRPGLNEDRHCLLDVNMFDESLDHFGSHLPASNISRSVISPLMEKSP